MLHCFCVCFSVFWLCLLLLLSICHKQTCCPLRFKWPLRLFVFVVAVFVCSHFAAGMCATDLFLLFCQLLASLLHLLLVMRSLCSTVPFSLCWVFYWSFIWIPTCFSTMKRLFPSLGHLYKITVYYLIYLPLCLKVFKCLTVKTNAEFTSATLLQTGVITHTNALSGLLFCSAKLHIQHRHCYSLTAKFSPDAVKVWSPANWKM